MRCSRKTRSFVVARQRLIFRIPAIDRDWWRRQGRCHTSRYCGLSDVGDRVLAPPHYGVGREPRLRREGTAQFAVVATEIETRTERGDHELRELAKPVAKSPLVARQRCITTSDCLEVLRGPARHIEHVRGWRAQLERAALVILNVVANATEQIDREAAQPCTLHEQPSRRRHEPDGSPNG